MALSSIAIEQSKGTTNTMEKAKQLLDYLATLLSMTDLFNYLLHYPTVFQSCDPKLPPFTNLPSKLIVTALFGRFKKVIPHYRTEGVSIQSHLQLNVRLDSHMVLQQLLFQPNWERRSKI